jgi:hypothetical protein
MPDLGQIFWFGNSQCHLNILNLELLMVSRHFKPPMVSVLVLIIKYLTIIQNTMLKKKEIKWKACLWRRTRENYPPKYIHGLFDKVRLEQPKMIVNKRHALKLNFADTFQHDFSMFHFSPSAVSCFQVWNRLTEEAKLSIDIWERGDWAAMKSILDFFNLHTYSPINSQVWTVYNEKYQCKFQAFKIKGSFEVENKSEGHTDRILSTCLRLEWKHKWLY